MIIPLEAFVLFQMFKKPGKGGLMKVVLYFVQAAPLLIGPFSPFYAFFSIFLMSPDVLEEVGLRVAGRVQFSQVVFRFWTHKVVRTSRVASHRSPLCRSRS